MKSAKLAALLILFTMLIISGCKKDEDNPVDPGNTGSTGYPTPTSFNGHSPANAIVIVRTTISQMGFSFSLGVGVANLNNQDKGTVTATVSGDQYEFQKNSSNGSVSYFYGPSATDPTGGISLNTGGTNASFSVSGYALTNNSVTVPGELTLTSPAASASVSRNSDLSVSWTGSSQGANKAIFIADKNGKSIFKEVSGSGGTFTAAEMSTLAAGEGALVYGITYNYVLTNNNEAVLIGEAVAMNTITLQ